MRRNIGHFIAICHYLISQVSSYYEEPSYTKYPFIVSIQGIGKGHICSGSLVSFKWVLTSAHCVHVYKKTPDEIHILAGAPNSPDEQMRMVDKIHCHDKFDSESLFNDIALLLLDQDLIRKKTVDIIYVPKYTMHIEMKTLCTSVELIGFEVKEVMEWKIARTVVRPALITFKHTVLSEDECAQSRKFKILKHTFCGYAKNMTACMWDTGGPAICEGLIYGLTFYGCPWDESPSYFTRVDRYLLFIEAIMGKNAPYPSAKRSSGDTFILNMYSISSMTFLVLIGNK